VTRVRSVAAMVAIVACASLGAAACSSSGGGNGSSATTVPVDDRGKTQVEIDAVGNTWVPANIMIDVGTTVTWVNKSAVQHNVKKSADALDFGAPFGVDLDQFGPGKSYTFTFPKTGTFPYTCTIHALMDGTVQVVAAGSGAASTTSGATTSTTG